ncbi:hypothetical protein TEA_000872 [Camellia sinensis var. sinensis]|uniref:Uncharacterized protein n=1 Tax=Camellia sinensis var. sinensis TaxID=542762 RepID=A0A4S4F4U7_CAMSN|nr:hypothetical protein TEA_000872 [Camellia sinensis var. sinensis]
MEHYCFGKMLSRTDITHTLEIPRTTDYLPGHNNAIMDVWDNGGRHWNLQRTIRKYERKKWVECKHGKELLWRDQCRVYQVKKLHLATTAYAAHSPPPRHFLLSCFAAPQLYAIVVSSIDYGPVISRVMGLFGSLCSVSLASILFPNSIKVVLYLLYPLFLASQFEFVHCQLQICPNSVKVVLYLLYPLFLASQFEFVHCQLQML